MQREKSSFHRPALEILKTEISVLTDSRLAKAAGITIAFTDRRGGVSAPPYDTLNLAAHVGDEPSAVDSNRARLLESLGLSDIRDHLVTAEQVHGSRVVVVDGAEAGSGAYAAGGAPPIPSADALVTTCRDVPLLLLFADCVPVIIVAPGPARGIAVVHAGWRGALARVPGRTAEALARETGSTPSSLIAYVGPHIGGCCYEVGEAVLSQFRTAFDTIAPVARRLDLGTVVRETLIESGLSSERIVEAGVCTVDNVDRFFSYRASNDTGRHGALAVIKGA